MVVVPPARPAGSGAPSPGAAAARRTAAATRLSLQLPKDALRGLQQGSGSGSIMIPGEDLLATPNPLLASVSHGLIMA